MEDNLSKSMERIASIMKDNLAPAFRKFSNLIRKRKRSMNRWKMQNKNGQNTKERLRNQVRLKGRGCKKRTGSKRR